MEAECGLWPMSSRRFELLLTKPGHFTQVPYARPDERNGDVSPVEPSSHAFEFSGSQQQETVDL